MTVRNIFDGSGCKSRFAAIAYGLLMSRRWICYADIMAEFLSLKDSSELPCQLSDCDGYGEMKKSFAELRQLMKDRGCGLETRGNNRNRSFRYAGTDDDPLSDLRCAKTIRDLGRYWKFCQDSAGFMPTSWLEYFFSGSMDLITMKRSQTSGGQCMMTESSRELKNSDLIPFLYDMIRGRKVLSICYHPAFGTSEGLIFHPHFLREYNGRWFLLGHAEGKAPQFGYILALDRIEGMPQIISSASYVEAPKNFHTDYFRDIVGVSPAPDGKAHDVQIRAHTHYLFNLINTKPLHGSQKLTRQFEDGYGDFSIHIQPNEEFYGRLLQLIRGVEIVSPQEVREEFHKRIAELASLNG